MHIISYWSTRQRKVQDHCALTRCLSYPTSLHTTELYPGLLRGPGPYHIHLIWRDRCRSCCLSLTTKPGLTRRWSWITRGWPSSETPESRSLFATKYSLERRTSKRSYGRSYPSSVRKRRVRCCHTMISRKTSTWQTGPSCLLYQLTVKSFPMGSSSSRLSTTSLTRFTIGISTCSPRPKIRMVHAGEERKS